MGIISGVSNGCFTVSGLRGIHLEKFGSDLCQGNFLSGFDGADKHAGTAYFQATDRLPGFDHHSLGDAVDPSAIEFHHAAGAQVRPRGANAALQNSQVAQGAEGRSGLLYA
jgi:hypothetical protein